MALAFAKTYLSCCFSARDEQPQYPDERTHLIPVIEESPSPYSNVTFFDQRDVQERLLNIVKSKEAKMVNVASRIPFNLHNRPLASENSRGSSSASLSTSRARYDDYGGPSRYEDTPQRTRMKQRADDAYPERDTYGYYPENGYSNTYVYRSRSPSVAAEQPRPQPILNLRLVGYDDSTRGRTRERISPTAIAPPTQPGPNDEADPSTPTATAPGTSLAAQPQYHFHIQDPGPLVVSFGD